MKNSESLFKHLEQKPLDRGAAGALADALDEEGTDEVLAYGVRWLVDKKEWLTIIRGGDGKTILSYLIHLPRVVQRPPFDGPIHGKSVEHVLRVFSAELWEFRKWAMRLIGGKERLPKAPFVAEEQAIETPAPQPAPVPSPFVPTAPMPTLPWVPSPSTPSTGGSWPDVLYIRPWADEPPDPVLPWRPWRRRRRR